MTLLCLSVIICTHNPRSEYLIRVLDALKHQSLPQNEWELLLIDNASQSILAKSVDLSWHPYPRHIREETLGLTHARLRGIAEAQADILVFVDDDNILDSDYLTNVVKISKDYPCLGAWGCGQSIPEFEVSPPDWAEPYLPKLALKKLDKDKWSNIWPSETTPCGAGLIIRKEVGKKYAELLNHNPARKKLGRTGNLLLAAEDLDLAATAVDIGLGTGQFVCLKLIHLIPASRLELNYLLGLVEGSALSKTLLENFRSNPETPALALPKKKTDWIGKIKNKYRKFERSKVDREFQKAMEKGRNKAIELIQSL
jgi:glycosyltransferase involved in cell wall biosynthesis